MSHVDDFAGIACEYASYITGTYFDTKWKNITQELTDKTKSEINSRYNVSWNGYLDGLLYFC